MYETATEKLTLHFDLNHYPKDAAFSLKVIGKEYPLTPHTTETLNEHAKKNKALELSLLSKSQKKQVTHFIEDVELPANAVGMYLIKYQAPDSEDILPDLAMPFIHIPSWAKRKHFRNHGQNTNARKLPALLAEYEVNDPFAYNFHDYAQIWMNSTNIKTPFATAEAIVFQHPDIITLRADIAATVIYEHIDAALKADSTLVNYISKTGSGIFVKEYAKDSNGNLIEPISTDENGDPLTDINGTPLVWEKDKITGKNVYKQYKLHEDLVGSADGSKSGALSSVLKKVLQSTRNDLSLNGQLWSKQHGITEKLKTNIVHEGTEDDVVLKDLYGPKYNWTINNITSHFGLKIYDKFEFEDKKLSFHVQNWANRYLGAFVEFFDYDSKAIDNPWNNDLDKVSKMKLKNISSGSTLAGIPLFLDNDELKFILPDNAVKANVYFGGLGIGNWELDLDIAGIIQTGIFNYFIPSFMIAISVGVTGFRYLINNLEDMEIDLAINAVKVFLGGPAVAYTAITNPKRLIGSFGEIMAGIVFSQILFRVAKSITCFTTQTMILEKAPVVGWIFQVASCAAGIADMVATTVDVLASPATITLEVARSIDVHLTVSPDSTHGIGTQAAIWPLNSDKWEIIIKSKGGTSIKHTGSMDSIKPNTILEEEFKKIYAAPNSQIQVEVNLYSANNWLCGKWSSPWMNAVANNDTSLDIKCSIIELLAPLCADTQYKHYQKLVYKDNQHIWQQTDSAPSKVLTDLNASPQGHALSRLVNMTINNDEYKLGYTYMASGQSLPLDYEAAPFSGQMYSFQSISVLGEPENGIKQPVRGFSLQPFICYDQFGPTPLFSLPLGEYLNDLNSSAGKPASKLVSTAFSNTGYVLPQGAIVSMKTESVEWEVGILGSQSVYLLRRETDTIKVFGHKVPQYSLLNFYLDTRKYSQDKKHYLRQVFLDDKTGSFDYNSDKSWGTFADDNIDSMVVHPNGYVIAVSYKNHKMEILKLPEAAVGDKDAPSAIPKSGNGILEGLMAGPKAITVTPDGRILILEQDNNRIQAFDTMGNPVPCFNGPLSFDIEDKFSSDLDNEISVNFMKAYQQNVQPIVAPLLRLPSSSMADLNSGVITDSIQQSFADHACSLSQNGQFTLETIQNNSIWMLSDAGSGLKFDIRKNLHITGQGADLFTKTANIVPDLDNGNAYVYLESKLLFDIPARSATQLNSKIILGEFKDQLKSHNIVLSDTIEIQEVIPNLEWAIIDKENNKRYAVDMEADIEVFRAPQLEVEIKSKGCEWLLRDNISTLAFSIEKDSKNAGKLKVQQLVSTMLLNDQMSTGITYLDIGVESKGFIYVLSFRGQGDKTSDYRLDIYYPDGTWLSRTPKNENAAGVNGAKLVVDKWRNLYTLNYETILGPNDRTEPSVSTWVPSEK